MSQVAEKIAAEIAEAGAIPFARFMDLALYCPVYGYYEKEGDTIGRRGDYYTSVSVGPLFGELLAAQFAEWLLDPHLAAAKHDAQGRGGSKTQGGGGLFQLVEAGAHRGELARDILNWLREQRPHLWEQVEYWILEPSERRRKWQERTLSQFKPKVHWAGGLTELAAGTGARRGWVGQRSPRRGAHLQRQGDDVPMAPRIRNRAPSDRPDRVSGIRGIIFSNELLDCFPVHRLGWDAFQKRWFEWGVTLGGGGRFRWARLPVASLSLENHISRFTIQDSDLAGLLPDGFVLEACPAAEQWWRQAAELLQAGHLFTIDYGLTSEQLLAPERAEGTLRAYSRHRLSSHILANPGQQDITAQVNFTALQRAGESAGLTTELFLDQSQFLTAIAARIWKGEIAFSEWAAGCTRQFKTLTHPEHLGRAFRALVQSRC